MSFLTLLFSIAVLVIVAALINGSEAVLSAASSDGQLEEISERYNVLSAVAQWGQSNRYQMLSTVLIAGNLVNIAAACVAAVWAVSMGPWGLGGAALILSLVMVVLSSLLPRYVVRNNRRFFLLGSLFLMQLFRFLLAPLLWFVAKAVKAASRVFGVDLSIQNSFVTKEDIEQAVKIGEAAGAIEESERKMIHSVILFEETRVSEIMVPRTDMHMLELLDPMEDVIVCLQQYGHSRIPVYEYNPDNVVGILYVKDLLQNLGSHNGAPLRSSLRKPLFVPETMKISDLFKVMQSQQIHMAIAVDEYGGTAGIITLEDLLEEIVGEIQDEYDREEPEIEKLSDNSWRIQAGLPLSDVNEVAGSDFQSDDVDSLGGYLLNLFGSFPKKGDSIQDGPWTFVVSGVGDHRITEVVLRRAREEAR